MMRAFGWKRWQSPSKGEWCCNETYPDYIGGAAGPLAAAAGERAGVRFLEFFMAKIRNPDTRRAYAQAADEFLAWCTAAGVPSIAASQPVHVSSWIEAGTRELAAPSVKQGLAAIRHSPGSARRTA